MNDLFMDPTSTPSPEIIGAAMKSPAAVLWGAINDFIQETFNAKPKVIFSTCQGKPGWNVKYKKSGKALCTLYPEQECLTALIVIDPRMVSGSVETVEKIHPWMLDLIQRTKPFQGKLWLMIPIADEAMLESTKQLLVMKTEFVKS